MVPVWFGPCSRICVPSRREGASMMPAASRARTTPTPPRASPGQQRAQQHHRRVEHRRQDVHLAWPQPVDHLDERVQRKLDGVKRDVPEPPAAQQQVAMPQSARPAAPAPRGRRRARASGPAAGSTSTAPARPRPAPPPTATWGDAGTSPATAAAVQATPHRRTARPAPRPSRSPPSVNPTSSHGSSNPPRDHGVWPTLSRVSRL